MVMVYGKSLLSALGNTTVLLTEVHAIKASAAENLHRDYKHTNIYIDQSWPNESI
jgi:hypothetical protein